MEFFADYGWLFGLGFCSHYAQENTFSSIVKLELNILERFVPNVAQCCIHPQKQKKRDFYISSVKVPSDLSK